MRIVDGPDHSRETGDNTPETAGSIEDAVRNAVSHTVQNLPRDGRCPAWLGNLAAKPGGDDTPDEVA